MNTRFRLCVFVGALLVAGGVWAEPSVEETKAFISAKLEACGEFYWEGDPYSVSASFAGDEVHFGYIIKHRDDDDDEDRNSVGTRTAKLSELSPDVEFVGQVIKFKCHTKICWKFKEESHKIGGVTQSDEGEETENEYDKSSVQDKYNVQICSEDSAKRLAKAFSHLIEKSGGKEELF